MFIITLIIIIIIIIINVFIIIIITVILLLGSKYDLLVLVFSIVICFIKFLIFVKSN